MDASLPPIPIEEQFRIMADSAPVLIWISGTDKSCYFFNAGWLRFTGRTLAEEHGDGWTQGVHPDDLQDCLHIYNRAFDAHQEFKMEYRLRRHDGQYRRVLDNGVPRYAADGTFAGYIGSCTDIDELLESERRQKERIQTDAVKTEQALNEELAASNEELSAINDELSRSQESLQDLNSELEGKVLERTRALSESEAEAQALNKELAASNEELSAINEEMTALNEELVATNEELHQSQEHLVRVNAELTESQLQLQTALEATRHSEQLFRSIAQNIPGSLIIVIDRQHSHMTIEGDLKEKMGYDSDTYQGKHPLELGQPERYEVARPLYERVLGGEHFSIEKKAASGENLLVHLVPLINGQGEVYAGLIFTLDVTEIKQAQEKSAKLAAIIESSDDAIVSKTLESVVTSWNNAAERMFGFTAEEIIGQTIYKIIPEDREHEEAAIIARLKNGERIEHFETQRQTKDGRLIDVSVTVSPIKDPQGRIIGASKIARDITEKKLDEQRKSDFIGMASHELKTPLTSLGAILQVLQVKLRHSEDSFISGAAGKANIQVKKMTTMINGFLNLSRLESGKITIDKHRFDLDGLIREVISETELTVYGHQFIFRSDGPVMTDADQDKIGSVISNLLSNAVKYSPKGKLVEVTCHKQGQQVTVIVRDEGIGIQPQDQEKLFERYYRVESSQTRHISGFGIGLYLCSEIIERHNGRIWVESGPGPGSTFYFSLPLDEQL